MVIQVLRAELTTALLFHECLALLPSIAEKVSFYMYILKKKVLPVSDIVYLVKWSVSTN